MQNTEQFQSAVAEYARIHYGSGGSGGGSGGYVPPYDNGILDKVESKVYDKRRDGSDKPHWLKIAETAKRRRILVDRYEGKYLDANFFKIWKHWVVYKINASPKKGVREHYEILSNTQKAVANRVAGKAVRKATSREIDEIRPTIETITPKGIKITGRKLLARELKFQ